MQRSSPDEAPVRAGRIAPAIGTPVNAVFLVLVGLLRLVFSRGPVRAPGRVSNLP